MERVEVRDLIAKYTLEPTMRDIFVEGYDDQCCIDHLLYKIKKRNYRILPIEHVNISNDVLTTHGLEFGNRGRVRGLSKVLEENRINEQSVTCVIDRDFDFLNRIDHENTYLYYTDFSCMEMYTFDEEVIESLFKTLGIVEDVPSLLINFQSILVELFLIRAANSALNLGLENLDYLRLCRINPVGIDFDRDEFITRYLNKNCILHKKDIFIGEIENKRSQTTQAHKMYIHGHDFINLLLWYLQEKYQRIKALRYNEVTIWKNCFLCIPTEKLVASQLFSKIISKLA